jgi:hypothetical protein
MDRDDSLMITGNALTEAETPKVNAFASVFANLPPVVRTETLRLDQVMRQIHASRFKARAFNDYAQPGLSAETLKRLYYGKGKTAGLGWVIIGTAALIDHRQCGGCGLAGCHHQKEVTIPSDTIKAWRKAAITNDKRGLSESWKAIIRDLVAGEEIPGLGTWRDLFAKAAPFAQPPDSCPWSLHRPPPGWSEASFMRHKADKLLYALGQKGSFAAWPELPEVRIDLTTLRPFEWLVVDDHRLDFKVFVTMPDGKVQLVELWGLFVMDVATRMIVSFALKPRVAREDGSTMAFEHRDMQHLITHVITTYGIPKDYAQRWIVENAAAAVSTDCERLLDFVTSGRVTIKRSGIQVGDFHMSGFPERWGNYRGKRWLESYFGPLDIVLGGVKGQMGSDYWSKPGSFDARQAFGNRLLKLLEKCTPEKRAKLALPFEWAGDAHWLVSEAVELLNHRTDHQLEGFPEVRFFAYDTTSQALPLCPQLAKLHGTVQHLESFSMVPQQLQELWLNNGGRPRRITPAEKMEMHKPEMLRLAPEAVQDLLFDEVTKYKGSPLLWRGGDALDLEIKRARVKTSVRFYGKLLNVEQGQKVIARLNTDKPELGVWLLNEKRQFLGHLRHSTDPTHDDLEGLHKMLGAQISALNQGKRRLNQLTNAPQDALDRIGDLEQLTDTINTMTGKAEGEELSALPESADFIRAVKVRTPSKVTANGDAQAFLSSLQ